jgi:IclR family pca regulon transcriptional regulator
VNENSSPGSSNHARDVVRSLERGLAVIRAFDAEHPRQTLSEVARTTGLTRAAARRFLLTLVELGYVRPDGREFALTARVLELGFAYLSSTTVAEVAAPHLEQLVAQVHESASVSVLDGTDVVYVARVPTARIMTVAITIGTRFPASATSMGRVLLAALEADELAVHLARPLPAPTASTVTDPVELRAVLARVRVDGHCLVDQELEQGLRSIAVPVRGRSGAVVAAMNVSTQAARRSAAALRRDVLPALRACADAVERDLLAP